jgi:hypothetical protein
MSFIVIKQLLHILIQYTQRGKKSALDRLPREVYALWVTCVTGLFDMSEGSGQ